MKRTKKALVAMVATGLFVIPASAASAGGKKGNNHQQAHCKKNHVFINVSFAECNNIGGIWIL